MTVVVYRGGPILTMAGEADQDEVEVVVTEGDTVVYTGCLVGAAEWLARPHTTTQATSLILTGMA